MKFRVEYKISLYYEGYVEAETEDQARSLMDWDDDCVVDREEIDDSYELIDVVPIYEE